MSPGCWIRVQPPEPMTEGRKMELRKRECPIKMEVSPIGYGWVKLVLEIGGDKYEIDISDCLGSGIGGFIQSLYQLYLGKKDTPDRDCVSEVYEYVEVVKDGRVVGRRLRDKDDDCYWEMPKTTTCDLDEEGHGYAISFQREFMEGSDFVVKVKVVEWGLVATEDEKPVVYTVQYSDLCYALGKALTTAVKAVGFVGFCENAWDSDISPRHLCFLKAAGLGHPEWVLPKYADRDSPAVSSFAAEMKLLEFDF